MRLAVVSDVHANRLALEAVLADMKAQGVDAIVNLGDHLAGPLDPAGTADMLMGLGALTIAGNHDRDMGFSAPGTFTVDRFASARLDARHVEWLRGLPQTAVYEGTVFLCHGTPRSDVECWLDGYWTNRETRLPGEAEVTEKAEGLDFPVFLCGHTHLARAVRLRDGRLVVNPGSVGLQTVHGSPDARYAVLERRNGTWSVALRAIPYDSAGAAAMAVANGFAHWHDALATGWSDPDALFTIG